MDLITDSLKDRYREPQRRYHTLQHIGELLGLLDTHTARLSDPEAVRLAIWYHDAVYDPMGAKGSNETLSAALFTADWQVARGHADDARHRAVERMIIATIDHDLAPGDTADLACFLDFDMSILGAPEERYREYAGQVRGEYAAVPEAQYRAGRAKFLQGAIAKPTLYFTRHFRDLCDGPARRNMTWELSTLLG